MGQKVNPISLRLETTNRGFDSCYYNHAHSTQLFVENLRLQLYLNNVLKQTGFSQGRVLISTFFRGCESNLFYFNPLYSRENKGKRFMIKSFRPIGSGKERDVKGAKHSSLSLKVGNTLPFQRVLKRKGGLNSFPFSLISEKVVSNSPSNLPSLFPPSNGSSLLGKGKNVDREEFLRTNGERVFSGSLSKIGIPSVGEAGIQGEEITPKANLGEKKLSSDVSKQLSLLVCLYQSVKNKRFPVFWSKKQKKGFEGFEGFKGFFTGENTEIHRERGTILSENKGKKGFLLKKEKETDERIKEYPLSFPSVLTFSDFLFGGVWSFQRNRDLLSLQRKKEKEGKGVSSFPSVGKDGDLTTRPFPLREEKRSPLTKEKPFLQKENSFSSRRENKEINRGYLEQKLFKDTGLVFYLSFLRALNSTQSALFLCQDIVYYLEKRVSFQRIKTVLLEQVSRDTRIKGIRVTCSGRAGGKSKRAQRSKVETFKDGQTSLGVFSSKIDFHCESGLTGFGLVGVKVWICYP